MIDGPKTGLRQVSKVRNKWEKTVLAWKFIPKYLFHRKHEQCARQESELLTQLGETAEGKSESLHKLSYTVTIAAHFDIPRVNLRIVSLVI